MAAGHLEELRRGYDLWNSGDLEAVIAETPQEVEYHLRNDLPDMPEVEVFRGPEGLRRFWEVWWRGPWEGNMQTDVDNLIEVDDDHTLALLTFRGVGKESGIPVEIRYSHLWTIRDGIAVRCDGYPGWKMGLEAAGLERMPE